MSDAAIDIGIAVLVLLVVADLIASARVLARTGDIDEANRDR